MINHDRAHSSHDCEHDNNILVAKHLVSNEVLRLFGQGTKNTSNCNFL